jgi:hypothetical protein
MAFNFEDGASVASLNTTNSGLPDGFDDATIATEAEVEDLTGEEESVDSALVDDVAKLEAELEASLPPWMRSDGPDVEYNTGDEEDSANDEESEESYASEDLDLLSFADAHDDLEKHLPEGWHDRMSEEQFEESEVSDDSKEHDDMALDSDEEVELRPMRELFPDTQEFKDRLLNLVDQGLVPRQAWDLVENYQALLREEAELNDARTHLLTEDESAEGATSKTVELENLLAQNAQSIADMEEKLHIALQSPIQQADEANGIASPRVEPQRGTESTAEGDSPADNPRIDSAGANPSAGDHGGRGG